MPLNLNCRESVQSLRLSITYCLSFENEEKFLLSVVPRMIKLRGLSLPQISLTWSYSRGVCGAKSQAAEA